MTDLDEMMALSCIARMGRNELEDELARLDADDPYVDGTSFSLREMETYASAAANVAFVEKAIRAARGYGHSDCAEVRPRGGARRKRAVSIDMDAYNRDKKLLDERRAKHEECESMREAVRRRLRHFEKRDGYQYRPMPRTPLEAYLSELCDACPKTV